jgi:hypothetical protein
MDRLKYQHDTVAARIPEASSFDETSKTVSFCSFSRWPGEIVASSAHTFDTYGSSSSDEAIFLIGSLDSQVNLLVDSIEKHVTSASESDGRFEKPAQNSKLQHMPNVVSLHSLRSSMAQQAGAVRNTIKYLEVRAQEQLHSNRSELSRQVKRENDLRKKVNELRKNLLERGMKTEELEVPGRRTAPQTKEFEVELQDLVATRDRVLEELRGLEEYDKLKNS